MVVVLGVLFYLIAGRTSEESAVSSHLLLPKIDLSAVKILQINRGNDQVRLSLATGRWVVEDRGGYSADASKITSMLLRLFDLYVNDSAKVINPDLVALGLAEDSFKQGFLKLSLYQEDQSELVKIFAGQGRAREVRQFAKPSDGQYVRVSSDSEAYLVLDPITLSASPKSWIDTNLLNVLQISVFSIEQFEIKDGIESEQFRFARTDPSKDTTPINIELRSSRPEGRTLEKSSLSQLRGILENTRIDDVFPVGHADVSGLTFDRVTRVGTRQGAVYSIFTAEKAEDNRRRIFARVKVSFDPKIVEEVKAALVSAPREPEQKEIVAATAAEVDRLNELFKPWVYELPSFQGQKFRFSSDDLFVVNRSQNVLKRE
jgi:hypothetical protein